MDFTPEPIASPVPLPEEMSAVLREWHAVLPFFDEFWEYPEASEQFMSRRGMIPVVLSAPHATPHVREGQGKLRDLATGPIVMAIATVTNASAVASVGNQQTDANFDTIDNPLRESMRSMLSPHMWLIDLHGMKDHPTIDICLALGAEPDAATLALSKWAVSWGRAHGLRIVVNTPFDATRPTTMTSIAQRDGAHAIEVEISRKFRAVSPGEPLSVALATFMLALVRQAVILA